jgi:ZIP family zinc transporter
VLAFNLDEHSYELAGAGGAVSGFAAGALVFFVVDRILANQHGALRRSIALGAALDSVPESVLIAFTIVEGGDVGGAVVAAVFLSNIGESLAGSARMRKAGLPNGFVRRLWIGVMIVAGISAALGYALFNGASGGVQGFGHALATGAAVCMLANTILPEAFRRDEPLVGIVVALGFILGFGLSLV